jgi:hypothetical protein
MGINRFIYHNYIFTGSLMLLAVSLPLSPFMVSLSQIILLVNWLVEGNFQNKLQQIRNRKTVLFFLMIYLAHLIWLIPTSDYSYALKDIKIKLPLLILPLVLGTSRALKNSEFKSVLLAFAGGVLISSFFSIYRLSTMDYMPTADIRDISLFISHIRLALLVNMAIFSIIYLLVTGTFQWQRVMRNSLWASLVWLIFFLFILKSITGIVIFIITGILFLLLFSSQFEKRYFYIKYPLQYLLISVVLVITGYIIYVTISFSFKSPIEKEMKTHSLSGNLYEHHPANRQIENGNYVWINISREELQNEWNRRSSIDFNDYDLKGQELRYTLIRYLASLGLDKDSAGMAILTGTDILNIERGMANHIYQYNKWVYPRIYLIIWEIDNYIKGGNPTGHSFSQRFIYWKAGKAIAANNFWFGVGTGDVAEAFNRYYAENETGLAPRWQLRAHNQFLTFLISFGLTGFLLVMLAMITPFFIERRGGQILPVMFASIALLSMLTEDTLETQAGATFFAFFYVLLIFAQQPVDDDNDERPD